MSVIFEQHLNTYTFKVERLEQELSFLEGKIIWKSRWFPGDVQELNNKKGNKTKKKNTHKNNE